MRVTLHVFLRLHASYVPRASLIASSSASTDTHTHRAISTITNVRTVCSCKASQHNSRSIHSTNHPTNINAQSSSSLIVVYLDTKIAHEREIYYYEITRLHAYYMRDTNYNSIFKSKCTRSNTHVHAVCPGPT